MIINWIAFISGGKWRLISLREHFHFLFFRAATLIFTIATSARKILFHLKSRVSRSTKSSWKNSRRQNGRLIRNRSTLPRFARSTLETFHGSCLSARYRNAMFKFRQRRRTNATDNKRRFVDWGKHVDGSIVSPLRQRWISNFCPVWKASDNGRFFLERYDLTLTIIHEYGTLTTINRLGNFH